MKPEYNILSHICLTIGNMSTFTFLLEYGKQSIKMLTTVIYLLQVVGFDAVNLTSLNCY